MVPFSLQHYRAAPVLGMRPFRVTPSIAEKNRLHLSFRLSSILLVAASDVSCRPSAWIAWNWGKSKAGSSSRMLNAGSDSRRKCRPVAYASHITCFKHPSIMMITITCSHCQYLAHSRSTNIGPPKIIPVLSRCSFPLSVFFSTHHFLYCP